MLRNSIADLYKSIDANSFPFAGRNLQDITIVPNFSIIDKDAEFLDMYSSLGRFDILTPYIVSAMKSVSSAETAMKGLENNVPVVLPVDTHNKRIDTIERLVNYKKEKKLSTPICMAFSPIDDIGDIVSYSKMGVDVLFSDCAYVASNKMLSFAKELINNAPSELVIGNVLSIEPAKTFIDIGVKNFKLGYGWGSICTSTLMTGVGRSQLDALMDFSKYRFDNNLDIKIILDGGIRQPGEIVKALALGADFIMSGFLFAGCSESSLSFDNDGLINYEGNYYESLENSVKKTFDNSSFRAEGKSIVVPNKGSISGVFSLLNTCIKLGMQLIGAENLNQLRSFANFTLTKPISGTENDVKEKKNFWFD